MSNDTSDLAMTFPIVVSQYLRTGRAYLYVDTRRHAADRISNICFRLTDKYFADTIEPSLSTRQRSQWDRAGYVAVHPQ
jgi:hypothetical protein